MSDKLLPLKFPNDFSKHYDGCEECGPEGDVGKKRTYELCREGKRLAVNLLYPSFDEQDKLHRFSPRL